MRMVNVTIAAILGIAATLVGGYAAQAAIGSFYHHVNGTIRGELSGTSLTTFDNIIRSTGNVALIWVVLTVFGFLLYFAMNVQKRDEVTGAY